MGDISNGQPMEPETFDRGNPARRCTAHRKNGDRCRKWAIMGGTVCATHGGRARQVREKARQRLMEYSDPAVRHAFKTMNDETAPVQTRLKASLAIIDRAGLGPQTAIDVSVTAKPFENIFEAMESGGSRAAHRRSIGADDDTQPGPVALTTGDDDDAIDAEIIENDGDLIDYGQPMTPDGYERGSGDDTAAGIDVFGAVQPSAPGELMSLDAAVSVAAAMRRNAATRPAQRALPPGRSARQ